ncbi:MAG: hypothetical protein UW73_C0017G0016 [Microgenomates group bacterium GW2011_GWB1_44_8]|nr:MAG: hypothetical protein UW73_C0017G0016 [Microgenomates group bacterium GW2011_GWB1_44_8]
MNTIMQVKRITVSLPVETYYLLAQHTQDRTTSKFVAQAIEEKLLKMPRGKSDVDEFLSLRDCLPKVGASQIKKAISRGRR